MKSFTASELRQNAAQVIEEARRDVVMITQYNKPTAAVMSWEAYESLLDTFDVLMIPGLEERVRQGISEFYADKVADWEKTIAKLGLPHIAGGRIEAGGGVRLAGKTRVRADGGVRLAGKTRVRADGGVRLAKPQPGLAYRILLTDEAEEDLGIINSEVTRAEIGRAINGLAHAPVFGKRTRYLAGLDMLRAGRAHYLIIYKTVEATRTITLIAILPGSADPLRLMKPFSTSPERVRKPRSMTAARREAVLAAEDRAYLKKKREEEKRFSELLDEELGE